MEDDYYTFMGKTYSFFPSKWPMKVPEVTPENMHLIVWDTTIYTDEPTNSIRLVVRLVDHTTFTVAMSQVYAQSMGIEGMRLELCRHLTSNFKKNGMPAAMRDLLVPPPPLWDQAPLWGDSAPLSILEEMKHWKKMLAESTVPKAYQASNHYYAMPPSPYPHPATPTGAAIVRQLTALCPAMQELVLCPACKQDPTPTTHWGVEPMALNRVVQHLNDNPHRWTREQIADWLETLDCDISFRSPEETADV